MLKHTMGQIPGGGTRRVYGVAYFDGARWFAKVGQSVLDCRWVDPLQPSQGDPIIIDITDDGRGQSTALVVGSYTDQPRPSTGTVLTVGVTELVVTGAFGPTLTTSRFIGSYAVGDPVYLTWDAKTPTVIGKVAAIQTPPAAPPPDTSPQAGWGVEKFVPIASDTYGVGGWGRWATSRNGGEDVYTGSMSGYVLTGSWFYGEQSALLAGKTVDRIRFYLGARLPGVGASGTVTVNVYAHTSRYRPGGDVNRTVGPFTLPVIGGFTGDYIDLPLSFAPILAAGGGISIAGGAYTGFRGRLSGGLSGKLELTWSHS